MSFLDKFFDRDRFVEPTGDRQSKVVDERLPAVMLAMRGLPTLHLSEDIIDRINELPHIGGDARLMTETEFDTGEAMLAVIEFGPHRVRVLGLDSPLPEHVVQRTVQPAVWGAEHKELVRLHDAHIILWYTGSEKDPVEQYLALYRVAYGFNERGLLGVVNEVAWTFTPAAIVNDLVEPTTVEDCREQVPPHFWIGFVQGESDAGTWFCTKGQPVFGVPDFAYLASPDDLPGNMARVFYDIFLYCYGGGRIEAGHTGQTGDGDFFLFSQPGEDFPFATVPSGTLVLTRIQRESLGE